MQRNKTSISKASTYKEIGDYWDTHELPEDAPDVEVTVEFESDVHHFYFAIENSMSARVKAAAANHGVSAETLINLWVKEKLDSELVRA